MNLSELYRKLIAAARTIPLDDRVPYTFEKSVMARLAGKVAVDLWDSWGRALSRSAVFCVAAMLLLSAGWFFLPSTNSDSLSQDVERTLLAAVDNNPDQLGESR
jgi:hypothetical protein